MSTFWMDYTPLLVSYIAVVIIAWKILADAGDISRNLSALADYKRAVSENTAITIKNTENMQRLVATVEVLIETLNKRNEKEESNGK